MSFLSRHRSQRALREAGNFDKSSGFSTPPRDHEEKPGLNSGSLRKRLSSFTLLGTPKRQNGLSQQSSPKPGGVGYVMPDSMYARERSRSPSPAPSLTIRRPSGLGRRASQRATQEHDEMQPTSRGRRPMHHQLSVSTPNLSQPVAQLLRWDEVSVVEERGSSELGYLRPDPVPEPRPFDFSRIPTELLKSLFADSTKRDLASITLACRAFIWPARTALYEHLDLRDIKSPEQVQRCMALLASRRDIATIVRTFACHVAPDAASTSGVTSLSTVTFAIALTNMVHLQSLILLRFIPNLLLHTMFQLKRFGLLCESMTLDECRDMFSWLTSQPALTSLSLPDLSMHDTALFPTSTGSQNQPGKPIPLEPSSRDTPILTIPQDVLSKLSHFQGSASLASIIVPERPIQSLSVAIHTTLYDGLRPSALMTCIARSKTPISTLSIVASSKKKVDPRTLERVLMSAGAELGASLQILEIEWILEDELLYKQIAAVLPRFTALHTLRLHRRLPPPPPRFPPPSLPLPTTASSNTPPPSPSSFFANSKVFAWTPPDSPNTVGRNRLSTATKRISLDVPLSRAHERTHLATWSKQCRTLNSVVFLSGAGWRIGIRVGEAIGASMFTYIGTAKT